MTESLRVLLVEDNELDARAMSRALGMAETTFHVTRAADLRSALAAVDENPFDCVLLDLSLPDSEGLMSVETLSHRSRHCPVVVLTGLDDPAIAVQAVERGAEDYLIKSTVTPELVARAIRYAVARHHSETQLQSAQALLDTMHDRERIARELHDTVIQHLFATGMALQAASGSDDPDRVKTSAIAAVAEIDEVIRELRQAIFGLHSWDEDVTLARDLSEVADANAELLGFTPELRIGEIAELPGELHHDVVAIVGEALVNVAKHAHASVVRVSVQLDDGDLVIRIEDNGTGFEPASGHVDGDSDGLTGHGLQNMAARADEHGGSLAVRRGTAGGAELEWRAPLDGARAR